MYGFHKFFKKLSKLNKRNVPVTVTGTLENIKIAQTNTQQYLIQLIILINYTFYVLDRSVII